MEQKSFGGRDRMNKKNTSGYTMMIFTIAVMVIGFLIAFSGGDDPTIQDVLNAIAIMTAGVVGLVGWIAMTLLDRLNMFSHLYEILTGESQEELAGTLQRLHNTIRQGASNVKWRLDSASSRLDQGEPDV
jgi:hypothetical protein